MPHNTIIASFILIPILCLVVYLTTLIIKSLRKYILSKEVREEKRYAAKSLGDALKQHRIDCKMTQEFVAETLGVSRQAVSKWETGASDPSTTNLLALAKLYGVSTENILNEIKNEN